MTELLRQVWLHTLLKGSLLLSVVPCRNFNVSIAQKVLYIGKGFFRLFKYSH